jgi:hypothetical protein
MSTQSVTEFDSAINSCFPGPVCCSGSSMPVSQPRKHWSTWWHGLCFQIFYWISVFRKLFLQYGILRECNWGWSWHFESVFLQAFRHLLNIADTVTLWVLEKLVRKFTFFHEILVFSIHVDKSFTCVRYCASCPTGNELSNVFRGSEVMSCPIRLKCPW